MKSDQKILSSPTLPVMTFPGKIVIPQNQTEVENAVLELRRETILGFDTESKPAFLPGVSYPISLIQLATHDTAFLFQVRHVGFPASLVQIFSDPSVQKVGVGIDMDIRKLRELSPFEPHDFIDLSRLAANLGIVRSGLKSLVELFFQSRIIKSSQTSDWSRSILTSKQILYAATDAWVCLKLYPHLNSDHSLLKQKSV